MEQIERIMYMENILNDGTDILNEFIKLYQKLKGIEPKINELEAYYSSDEYLKDVEDDENNNIPTHIKRGVLSEDAIYDFLEQYDYIKNKILKK